MAPQTVLCKMYMVYFSIIIVVYFSITIYIFGQIGEKGQKVVHYLGHLRFIR